MRVARFAQEKIAIEIREKELEFVLELICAGEDLIGEGELYECRTMGEVVAFRSPREAPMFFWRVSRGARCGHVWQASLDTAPGKGAYSGRTDNATVLCEPW